MRNEMNGKEITLIYTLTYPKLYPEDNRQIKNVNTYLFRLTGVPPNQAIKLIQINPTQSVVKIKKKVITEYKLNPILTIQFIFKGKALPDHSNFSRIGISPIKDILTVISRVFGAGNISNVDQY